jgi:hypothetical protein
MRRPPRLKRPAPPRPETPDSEWSPPTPLPGSWLADLRFDGAQPAKVADLLVVLGERLERMAARTAETVGFDLFCRMYDALHAAKIVPPLVVAPQAKLVAADIVPRIIAPELAGDLSRFGRDVLLHVWCGAELVEQNAGKGLTTRAQEQARSRLGQRALRRAQAGRRKVVKKLAEKLVNEAIANGLQGGIQQSVQDIKDRLSAEHPGYTARSLAHLCKEHFALLHKTWRGYDSKLQRARRDK